MCNPGREAGEMSSGNIPSSWPASRWQPRPLTEAVTGSHFFPFGLTFPPALVCDRGNGKKPDKKIIFLWANLVAEWLANATLESAGKAQCKIIVFFLLLWRWLDGKTWHFRHLYVLYRWWSVYWDTHGPFYLEARSFGLNDIWNSLEILKDCPWTSCSSAPSDTAPWSQDSGATGEVRWTGSNRSHETSGATDLEHRTEQAGLVSVQPGFS